MNTSSKQAQTPPTDQGFSLLETLIALAILSLASMALFQGTSTLLRVSNKAISIGENTLDHVITTQSLHNLAAGIMAVRGGQGKFNANTVQFSAMSSNGLLNHDGELEHFTLRLIRDAQNGRTLIYQPSAYQSGPTQIPLLTGLDSSVQFSYLGLDQKWYGIWPPKSPPIPPNTKNIELITMPLLPQAIRLAHKGTAKTKTQTLQIDWLAAISYDTP